MLPKVSHRCIVFQALKPHQMNRMCKFSSVHNQMQKFKFANNLLRKSSLQNISKRYFRVKGDKPGIDFNASRVSPQKKNSLRPQPIGKANNESRANFWTFALKVSAYTAGFTTLAFGSCALWQQANQQHAYEKNIEERTKKKSSSKTQADLAYMWNHLPMVNKVTYTIIGLNVLVWAGWKLAKQQTMMKWFTLSLNSGQKHFRSMFLSMFSHKSFIHLYVNMYVLSSFCVAWDRLSLKGNASSNGHERFVAFYLTAGMCSGLLSILVKFLGQIPQPSLGASGAIMGLVGYICEKMPDTRLGIVFLPNWTFSARSAKNFIIAFDTVGLLIGALSKWRYIFFDHAGHLGGILFGIWYARGGDRVLNDFSAFVMRLRQQKR